MCSPVITTDDSVNNDLLDLKDKQVNHGLEIVHLSPEGPNYSPQVPEESQEESDLVFKDPEGYSSSEDSSTGVTESSEVTRIVTTEDRAHIRRARSTEENEVFTLGTCEDCYKIVVRDTIFRHPKKGLVSTIVTYDGVRCVEPTIIACVKIIDRSDNGDGANVSKNLGGVGDPYLKLNITSNPDKGYRLFLEIRGKDPSNPNCP